MSRTLFIFLLTFHIVIAGIPSEEKCTRCPSPPRSIRSKPVPIPPSVVVFLCVVLFIVFVRAAIIVCKRIYDFFDLQITMWRFQRALNQAERQMSLRVKEQWDFDNEFKRAGCAVEGVEMEMLSSEGESSTLAMESSIASPIDFV